MKIEIDEPSKTLTFDVYGKFEDLTIIKESLEKLPHLVVREIHITRGDDYDLSITCLFENYNTVIKILQDFITDNY